MLVPYRLLKLEANPQWSLNRALRLQIIATGIEDPAAIIVFADQSSVHQIMDNDTIIMGRYRFPIVSHCYTLGIDGIVIHTYYGTELDEFFKLSKPRQQEMLSQIVTKLWAEV